jgi:ubiquinone/menaquinone biosynthesis C-methylase UbiE
MDIKKAYNSWSEQYDTNINKTRDLEAAAIRETLQNISFANCLEIGCGTGKNTSWLITKANKITAVDLSEEMLKKAKEKVSENEIQFIQADINKEWTFTNEKFDLVTFSLVLEHIENLENIFEKAAHALKPEGYIYIGELHPFKQYTGSKARFETPEGVQVVQCFNHNISDFINAAKKYGLRIVEINEYFDDNVRTTIPRIISILFNKPPKNK